MIDIYTDYAAVLTVNRHESRAAPMLDLVTLGIDYGYDVALSDLYYRPSSDPADETVRLEGIIVKCAVALGNRLGVGMNPQIVYQKPKETVRILQGLLERFEDYDDSDSLYGIVMSGETPEYILENMCRLVYGDDNLHFEDLIERVGPRVMTVMRNFLSAAALDERKSDPDYARIGRIAAYLRAFPQNPSAFIFLNLPQEPDMLAIQQSLVFDEEDYTDEEYLVMYSVGLSVVANETFDSAYSALASNLDNLNTDNFPTLQLLEAGLKSLKEIYGHDDKEKEANYESD